MRTVLRISFGVSPPVVPFGWKRASAHLLPATDFLFPLVSLRITLMFSVGCDALMFCAIRKETVSNPETSRDAAGIVLVMNDAFFDHAKRSWLRPRLDEKALPTVCGCCALPAETQVEGSGGFPPQRSNGDRPFLVTSPPSRFLVRSALVMKLLTVRRWFAGAW